MVAAATKIYETIGVYLGYATAQFKDFYEFGYFLIVGRVTKVPPPNPVITMLSRQAHAGATPPARVGAV